MGLGKDRRRNEKSVIESLGLTPTPLSGSGWLYKEDGESEHILCQLKSTDREQITVKLLDVRQLIKHSRIAHKTPVFVLDFGGREEPLVIVRAGDLQRAARYLKYPNGGKTANAEG